MTRHLNSLRIYSAKTRRKSRRWQTLWVVDTCVLLFIASAKMWMDDEVNVSMKYLLNGMDQEYGTNIDDNDLVDVQRHVLTCIRSREAEKTPATVEEHV